MVYLVGFQSCLPSSYLQIRKVAGEFVSSLVDDRTVEVPHPAVTGQVGEEFHLGRLRLEAQRELEQVQLGGGEALAGELYHCVVLLSVCP